MGRRKAKSHYILSANPHPPACPPCLSHGRALAKANMARLGVRRGREGRDDVPGKGRQWIVDGLALILFHGKGSHWMVHKMPSYLTYHLLIEFYFLGLAYTSVLDFLCKSL